MVTSWRLFVMQKYGMPSIKTQTIYMYTQNYQTQLYICRPTTSLHQVFFVVFVDMQIYPD